MARYSGAGYLERRGHSDRVVFPVHWDEKERPAINSRQKAGQNTHVAWGT